MLKQKEYYYLIIIYLVGLMGFSPISGGLSAQFGVLVFLLCIFQIHIFIGYILGTTATYFLSMFLYNTIDIDGNLAYIICYLPISALMLLVANKIQNKRNIKKHRRLFSRSRLLISLLLSVFAFYIFQYYLLPEIIEMLTRNIENIVNRPLPQIIIK